MKRIDLSLCVVNYRADEELRRCLASIKRYIRGISYEVIVIDNSKKNRWYSGGNNAAFERARGRYVAVLNPDCYLKENGFKKLITWMDERPEVGIAEPRQLYDDGSMAPTGSLLSKWWIDLFELTELSRVFGSVGRIGMLGGLMRVKEYRQASFDRRKTWETQIASGAAMMIREDVIDQIGGFDERLRLYYTDADFCRRALLKGWQVWHVGEASVWHSTRRSTDRLRWSELYRIYARDAKEYYLKWGEKFGGRALYLVMMFNLKLVEVGKRFRK